MLLLLSIAFADAREDLENALLARSLGDRTAAAESLVPLIRTLAADDPLRGLALLWAATISVEMGDPTTARMTLRECIRNVPAREECTDLLGRLELEQSAMVVPGRWNFSGEHGVVHRSREGTVRVEPVNGDPALIWISRQIPDQAGTLVFAVRPEVRPKRLSLRLTTTEERAVVLPQFMDDSGMLHRARRPVVLTKNRARSVVVELKDVPGLDPSRLERVLLRDLSSASEAATGTTVLIVDDVSIR